MWTKEKLIKVLKESQEKGGRYLATTLGALNRHHKDAIRCIVPCISESFKEDLYLYYHEMTEIPKCECNRNFRFGGFNLGYSKKTCVRECSVVIQKKKTGMQKTWNTKYGGQHPMKTEKTKSNLKIALLEKYGFDNITKYRISEGTYVSNFSSPAAREKINKTNEEKYGGHPMQTTEIMEKQKASSKLFYDYFLPSGKKIRLQGYEGRALDELLKKYEETDILTSVKEINKKIGIIEYTQKRKKRRYYPDFFVISENKIYEVKSTWTYNANKEESELKKEACLSRGFSFEFIIY